MPASHPVSKRTAAKRARRRSASAKLPDNAATSAERFFVEVVSQGATEGSLEDKKLRLTRRVLFLARRWQNLMDEALRDTGDSHARWTTLLWVDLLKGRANHRELAERVGVELPTLIRLLNKLEGEGVVERRALPGSAQSKTVVLTRLGRAQFKRMGAVVLATRAEFLRDVDDAQLTAALTLLDSLLNKYARVVKWSDWK
jgi:MarR family transcriptional regulator for hemolysin